MTSHAVSDRQYKLLKVKKTRCTGKPSFKVRLDDDMTNKGCVINKIEKALRARYPHLQVHRSGETLTITRKKRSLFPILDTVVAEAIEKTNAIGTTRSNREKANQDHRPRHQRVIPTASIATERDDAASLLAIHVASTTPGWFTDLPELADELSFGRNVPAFA